MITTCYMISHTRSNGLSRLSPLLVLTFKPEYTLAYVLWLLPYRSAAMRLT